jgi:hypothetical protein
VLRRDLEQFVAGPLFDSALFNGAGIRDLLHEHYDRGIDHSELILYLAVVHRSLEYFVYSRPTAIPDSLGARAIIPWHRDGGSLRPTSHVAKALTR